MGARGRHVTGRAAGAERGCTRGAMACAGDDGPWGPGGPACTGGVWVSGVPGGPA